MGCVTMEALKQSRQDPPPGVVAGEPCRRDAVSEHGLKCYEDWNNLES